MKIVNIENKIETKPKEGLKEKIIGGIILLVVIIVVIVLKINSDNKKNLVTVRGAVGGGKENFLADEKFNEILSKKYSIKFSGDSWSNGKLVKDNVVDKDNNKYDLIFFSDVRYYDYFKLQPNPALGEVPRERVVDGNLTLNTPIVIYSWDSVVNVFIKEGIVTIKDGVYYITNMQKLLDYILEGKKWEEIGLDIYGRINIASTDPVSSSPGATYYGLLLSIMSQGDITYEGVQNALPKLKEFYLKSGYMNNTPADLFEMYLKTGVGAKPLIVDYEKSIIDFSNSNPDGWNQVKDKVRILYPTPTIWNSHCIATFNDKGNSFLKAFNDKDIQQLAWSKYGFRVGISGGNYDVTDIQLKGVPQTISSVTPGLKMDVYNQIIDYLAK